MTEPKFAVGDLVDVRAEDFFLSAVRIKEIILIEDGEVITQGEETFHVAGGSYWTYDVGVDSNFFEAAVFPHNPPSDFNSYDEMMTDLKSGKRVEVVA